MANYNTPGGSQEDYEARIVDETIRKIDALGIWRAQLNLYCEEVAALIKPSHRGHFMYLQQAVPYNMNNSDQQVDASGMMALSRFMAICDSLITPRNMQWQQLSVDDPVLRKNRAVRMWLYNTTRKLFEYRYDTVTNFPAQNQMVWESLGAFGTGVIFIDHYYDLIHRKRALRYKNIPFGKIYLTQNHQGVYDGFIRIMRFTAEEALRTPEWAEKLKTNEMLMAAARTRSQQKWNFLHHVTPRFDWDPMRLDMKGKPYASFYVFREGRMFLGEGGYRSLPIAASRYYQAPDEQDGRSPAMDVLPALKTLNTEKKVFLKAGHRAVDPVLLLQDDGLLNMSLKPGAQNKGGWSAEGKPLVGTLPIGKVEISAEMMADEKSIINDAFLVALFQIMTEKNGMTATEVVERINEKGILIAPTLGRQEGEYLGPMTYRELVCLAEMGVLDPMPPILKEAGGEFRLVSTSPLAKAMRAQEAAGFMRTLEATKELVNITGDASLLDPFNFDRAIPGIADIQGVPEPWLATPQEIAQKRQARAKQAQIEQQIKAAPAAAALAKAGVGGPGAPAGGAPQRTLAPTPTAAGAGAIGVGQ